MLIMSMLTPDDFGPILKALGDLSAWLKSLIYGTEAAEDAGPTTVVIGRVKDLQNLAPGEESLLGQLPDLGNPQLNWYQNSSVLRAAMARGFPIRDASPGDTGGVFLNAERNLLRSSGWTYNPNTNLWMPPD